MPPPQSAVFLVKVQLLIVGLLPLQPIAPPQPAEFEMKVQLLIIQDVPLNLPQQNLIDLPKLLLKRWE